MSAQNFGLIIALVCFSVTVQKKTLCYAHKCDFISLSKNNTLCGLVTHAIYQGIHFFTDNEGYNLGCFCVLFFSSLTIFNWFMDFYVCVLLIYATYERTTFLLVPGHS